MRAIVVLLSGVVIVSCLGCRKASTSTATNIAGPPTSTSVIGPVPGGLEKIDYRKNPYNNDPVARQDGRRLFDWYNCSGCHGGHAGGGMGPSLRDPEWLYGNRDDQIFDSIAHGRSNGMPTWGTKIPETQIWELVAYIRTMGTPQEPDPPVEPAEERVPDSNGTSLTSETQQPAKKAK